MCPQKHTCSSKPVCVAHLQWLVDTPGAVTLLSCWHAPYQVRLDGRMLSSSFSSDCQQVSFCALCSPTCPKCCASRWWFQFGTDPRHSAVALAAAPERWWGTSLRKLALGSDVRASRGCQPGGSAWPGIGRAWSLRLGGLRRSAVETSPFQRVCE